jgi:hypothetical protein
VKQEEKVSKIIPPVAETIKKAWYIQVRNSAHHNILAVMKQSSFILHIKV